jgi:hypothetical protein
MESTLDLLFSRTKLVERKSTVSTTNAFPNVLFMRVALELMDLSESSMIVLPSTHLRLF